MRKQHTVLFFAVWAVVTRAAFANDPWYAEPWDHLRVHPILEASLLGSSESGGVQDEYREQNRGRALAYGGMDLSYAPTGTLQLGARGTGRYLYDYHRYNAGNQTQKSELRMGEIFVFAAWLASAPTDDTARPVAGIEQPGAYLAAGRMRYATDFSGLLLSAEAPALRASLAGESLRVGGGGVRMEREFRVPGKRESRNNQARFYHAFVDGSFENLSLHTMYGLYRSPGRAQVADWYLPGFNESRVSLENGQSSLPDLDVHYYGVRLHHRIDWFSYSVAGLYNHGRSVSVAADGTRIGDTRQSIRGGLAQLNLTFHLGEQEARSCPESPATRSVCFQDGNLEGGPIVRFSGLYTTRDRNDGDDTLRGFGALRPLPVLMGGPASLFLSGPAPEDERPPFQNRQPVLSINDSGNPSAANDAVPRDNVDPAPPDYENEGLQMGGVEFATVVWRELTLSAHVNYAEFLTGQGTEGLLILRWPFIGKHWQADVFFSASAARYSTTAREIDPYTGTTRRTPIRYYRRYLAGISFLF